MQIEVGYDSNGHIWTKVTSEKGDTVDTMKETIISLKELLPKTKD